MRRQLATGPCTSPVRATVACVGLAALLLAVGCRARDADEGQPAAVVEPSRARSSPAPSDTNATAAEPSLPGLVGDETLDAELRRARLAKGDGYTPRTEHLRDDDTPEFTNRLILETSPYLLQHAHNPVNWRPWSDEAFAVALSQDKPVLLSIGYSTCHWCHVMERESFENEEIAAFINEHYVAIKVDREERPDVDEVYMDAVRALNHGRGGWPMTLLLTPERQPFFGGTYLPPRDARGRPGFLSVLRRYADEYQQRQGEIVERARSIAKSLETSAASSRGGRGAPPSAQAIESTVRRLLASHDAQWGGFGNAPKFPRPANLELLTRWVHRTKDPTALTALTSTLDKMIEGGLHDHIGGGFHRYSVDARWLVPHFEKMLYDNAQLAVVLLEAHALTGERRYADVARETLDYLTREMRSPEGAFYSATDADSPVPGKHEQEEGWFFTWTPRELEAALGPEVARAVAAYFGVTERGNFEGRNILHTWRSVDDVATDLGMGPDDLRRTIAAAKADLYVARQTRPAPLRDDKILAGWNGLALSAFAQAARRLDDRGYLETATTLGDFLWTRMVVDGRLHRSYTRVGERGRLGERAYLDDYAFVTQGLLDVFEATSDARWLERALALQAELDAHFADPAGGYFTTADDAEKLLSRQKPGYDGAEPSGNSVAALNLLRLHAWTLDARHLDRARALLGVFAGQLQRGGTGLPRMLVALDFFHDRSLQVFVVEAAGDPAGATALAASWRRTFAPNKVSAFVPEGEVSARSELMPGLAEKIAMGGKSTAYVCEGRSCKKPTSDPTVFASQLSSVMPYAQARQE